MPSRETNRNGNEGAEDFSTALRYCVSKRGGDWAADEEEQGLCAFYVSDGAAEEVEEFLGDRGYQYEGDDRTTLAEPGGYKKFGVGNTIEGEREFMFRVTLKE